MYLEAQQPHVESTNGLSVEEHQVSDSSMNDDHDDQICEQRIKQANEGAVHG